jgi:hypothetical protein
MGIFQEMWDGRTLSHWEYQEIRRMLSEAIASGYVEKIQVLSHKHIWSKNEEWYRDMQTGEIYTLTAPWERGGGHWARVDLEDLSSPGENIQ